MPEKEKTEEEKEVLDLYTHGEKFCEGDVSDRIGDGGSRQEKAKDHYQQVEDLGCPDQKMSALLEHLQPLVHPLRDVKLPFVKHNTKKARVALQEELLRLPG